jgi:hypothetical protein
MKKERTKFQIPSPKNQAPRTKTEVLKFLSLLEFGS